MAVESFQAAPRNGRLFRFAKPSISWRAAVLRSLLRVQKVCLNKLHTPIPIVRKRLKRIEPFVPGRRNYTQMVPIDAGGVSALQIAAHESRPDRCILYFHGGGYAVGTAALYRDFLWRIAAAARAQVPYFDYRLAPECPFPAAIEDAISAYRRVSDRFEPRRIAFVGDSAGGGLAFATLLKLRDQGVELPRAAVALSPWTDLALAGPSWKSNAAADPMMDITKIPGLARAYAAGTDPRHPHVSPLYGDPTGLPSTLIHVGSDEILRDDAVGMADRMRSCGCDVEIDVWPSMPHVWHLYARILPEGRLAIKRIGEFLQTRI
jgi:monoterpene epsilon-lactone hydrolase